MYKFSPLVLIIILLVSSFFSLVELYATVDNIQYPLSSSLYYLATAFIIIIFQLKINSYNQRYLINNIMISLFSIWGISLSLLCLYALEVKPEPLAASIFFFSSMLIASSIFFVKPVLESNK